MKHNKYVKSLINIDVIKSIYLKKIYNILNNHKADNINYKLKKYTGIYPISKSRYIDDKLFYKTQQESFINTYSFIINNIKCSFNYYYFKSNKRNIDKYLIIISYILGLFNVKNNINIHLIELEDKKIFNNKFTSNQINSGYTHYRDNKIDIFVYRKEESTKVLIHELLHSVHLSGLYRNNKKLVNYYNNIYNVNIKNINIDEIYIELWSRILNCYICSKYSKNHNYNTFNKYISIEKRFSEIQVYKLCKYINNHKNIDINKYTHIVEYYLAVNQILHNINEFLKYRLSQKNIFYLKDIQSFIHFIISHPEYKLHKIRKNSIFNNTFRMSVIEFNLPRR